MTLRQGQLEQWRRPKHSPRRARPPSPRGAPPHRRACRRRSSRLLRLTIWTGFTNCRSYSKAGGFAAAALTFVAILLAKLAVIQMLLNRSGLHRSIADLNPSKLGFYFFSPISLIIIAIGMGAAYRTANGSASN